MADFYTKQTYTEVEASAPDVHVTSSANDTSHNRSDRQFHAHKIVLVSTSSHSLGMELTDYGYAHEQFSSLEEVYVYFAQKESQGATLTPLSGLVGMVDGVENAVWIAKLKQLKGFQDIPFIGMCSSSAQYNTSLIAGWDDCVSVETDAQAIDTVLRFQTRYGSALADAAVPTEAVVEPVLGFGKRALDILIAGSILLVFSPIMLLVAFLIKVDSPGPFLYISKRVGAGFKTFDFYKFRSMRTGADKELQELMHLNQYGNGEMKSEGVSPTLEDLCLDCISEGKACSSQVFVDGEQVCQKLQAQAPQSAFVKLENDPRVTPFGRFIRKTSLDELPQLFNVLRGDMSIVGNRPLPEYEAEVLTDNAHAGRFLGPGGITGLWQVTKRGQSEMSDEDRIQLDITYAKRHSFWYDLGIMLKTIPAMIQKEAV